MKPFLKWAGGKTQLLDEINNRYIASKKYCEPFIGGGAVLFDLVEKNIFDEIYISDINKELISTYKSVRDNCKLLIESLKEIEKEYLILDKHERELYYYSRREKFNSLIKEKEYDEFSVASNFLFLNKTCFNGLYRVNSKGLFNVPIGSYKNPTISDDKNLLEASSLLKGVEIINAPYEACYEFVDEQTFVYMDPPYRPLSDTSSFNSYSSSSFNDESQTNLKSFIDILSMKKAKVLLSNSDTKDNFFDELYSEYTIERVMAKRMINSKGTKRNQIEELLIRNY